MALENVILGNFEAPSYVSRKQKFWFDIWRLMDEPEGEENVDGNSWSESGFTSRTIRGYEQKQKLTKC